MVCRVCVTPVTDALSPKPQPLNPTHWTLTPKTQNPKPPKRNAGAAGVARRRLLSDRAGSVCGTRRRYSAGGSQGGHGRVSQCKLAQEAVGKQEGSWDVTVMLVTKLSASKKDPGTRSDKEE